MNINSYLASKTGVTLAVCLTILVALIFVLATVFLWWTEIKQRRIKDLFDAIGEGFKRLGDRLSPNKPVKTVYTDKSRNYSGTEFLPVPVKAPTKEYTYEFAGWDKNYVDEKGNTVARPIYIQKVNTCRINVFDDDGETLFKTEVIEYGAGIDLSDIKPTKPESKEFFYEFVGWDKETTAFYKNENVCAVYRAVPKTFTYTFYGEDGKMISQTTAIYGTPILAPEPPRNEDLQKEFVCWRGYENGMILTRNETFVAVYRKPSDEGTGALDAGENQNMNMRLQSLASLVNDRQDMMSKQKYNESKEVILTAPAEGEQKKNDYQIFNLGGSRGLEASPSNEIIEKNDPEKEKQRKGIFKKKKVQKLEAKTEFLNEDEITSKITYIGKKDSK